MEVRINCIPVEYLTDQHLLAEWVETLMLPAYINRSIKSKNGIILSESKNYVLGFGHARFFYDKLSYVENRYKTIEIEMKKRGYKANPTLDLDIFSKDLFNSWTPTIDDQITNLNRIISRIQMKPDWYNFYGSKVVDWIEFYNERFNYIWEHNESYIGNF